MESEVAASVDGAMPSASAISATGYCWAAAVDLSGSSFLRLIASLSNDLLNTIWWHGIENGAR